MPSFHSRHYVPNSANFWLDIRPKIKIIQNMSDEIPPDGPQPDESGFPELPKIIKFDSLARCGDEVWIEHNGQIYRLRKTRQEKLILTK